MGNSLEHQIYAHHCSFSTINSRTLGGLYPSRNIIFVMVGFLGAIRHCFISVTNFTSMEISKHLDQFEKQIKSCGRKFGITALVFISLYLLIGNARSIQPNPFVTGGTIAVNMVIPVLAGVLFGRWMGFVVGFFAAVVNGLLPEFFAMGTQIDGIDILAAIPHAIMGFLAGVLSRKYSDLIAFSSLLVGHILNLTSFYLAGIMTMAELKNPSLWGQILVETIIGMMACMVLCALYRLAFLSPKRELCPPV